jgi:hypothetical protein
MEATKNRGERGLSEAIVIRRTVGILRNWKGAQAFARLRSVFGTWKLRGEDRPRTSTRRSAVLASIEAEHVRWDYGKLHALSHP